MVGAGWGLVANFSGVGQSALKVGVQVADKQPKPS